MKHTAIFLLIFLYNLAYAQQSKFVSEISELINSGAYDKAQKAIDNELKNNPKNVDAYMMHGNLIYYKFNSSGDLIFLGVNNNESIYDNSIGFLGEQPPVIIPTEVANKIINEWLKGVQIDKTRDDIHLGICHVYSISLQKDKLIEYLPILKEHIKMKNPHYGMCDYARNLIARERFDEGLEVYKAITKLYPSKFGLYSDIAAEYYQAGQVDSCFKYLDIAIKNNHDDEMTFGNGFFMYSVMGQYQLAMDCLKKQSQITKTQDHIFYKTLLDFRSAAPSDIEALKNLNNETYSKFAKIFLDSQLANEEKYKKLIELELNDAYKILIHEAYRKELPLAQFNYAESLTYNKIYPKAISEFEILDLEPTDELIESYHLYIAWAYHESGKPEKASIHWKALLPSDNFYFKSASAYFLGIYQLDIGNEEEAESLFKLVSDRANESKYATYCWNFIK